MGIQVERVGAVRVHQVASDPDAVVVEITITDGAKRYFEFTRAEFKQVADQWAQDAALMGAAAGSA